MPQIAGSDSMPGGISTNFSNIRPAVSLLIRGLRVLRARQYDLAATFALIVFLVDPGLPSARLPGLRTLTLVFSATLGLAAYLLGSRKALSGPSLIPLVCTKEGSAW